MQKRLLYGSAIVALVASVVLVLWLGSFRFGEFGPADPTQTFIFWATSSLVFVLMVTLGFILFRTGVKLYIERRSNREGSRIKTKLVIGALALSFMPALFLVLFSVHVLNRNIDKWFSQPLEAVRQSYNAISVALRREIHDEASLAAALLAEQTEAQQALAGGQLPPGYLQRFAKKTGLESASLFASGGAVVETFGPVPTAPLQDPQLALASAPVESGGKLLGHVAVSMRVPVDIAEQQAAIERNNRFYAQLAGSRRQIRMFYLAMMALITLFVLFVATWIARFLADQISTPISALLHAAGEVRRGNLGHRVQVRAIDELAVLVRAFNEMTRDLETSSRELDARSRFTEAILESIPTGVISIDASGAIKRVNRALGRIFPAEQVSRASRLEDLFSRDDTAEIKYLMKRARRTGLASRQIELRTEHQNLHISVTVSALEEKLTSGFVVVLEDTSDLLRAQKAAAWNEVARRVAHEIKNPLTPIALSAERIARQLVRLSLPPEPARIMRECAESITQSVESVKTLVNEFSQFARFPAAQPARCDLNEIVESAVAIFSGRLDGIEIHTELDPGLPPVYLDKEQFKRVVINLVDNAAEAMQDALVKKLFLGTQPGGPDAVELIIADTGCGVSPEDKEKLFLPYFSTKGRGTGLGLAIVNHILADHNATIRVEDNVPTGARFTVEIPTAAEAEQAAAPEGAAAL